MATLIPMPTYDYKCDACGKSFEKFQSMSSAPIKKCPNCGKNKVRRLIGTGAGLIFKGSGFYITDYRDSKYQEKAKADTAGGGETKTDSSGGESKPGENKPTGGKTNESSPKSSPKSEAKSEAKSESKPETKPAATKIESGSAAKSKSSSSDKK